MDPTRPQVNDAKGPQRPLRAPRGRYSKWLIGIRVRTLPAALVPVAVGASVAYSRTHLRVGVAGRVPIVGAVAHHGKALLVSMPEVSWAAVVLALVVAISMQVGVNLANDYSDGVRGTDKERVGPPRMVGSGMAKPRSVKIAAIGAFGIGAAAGLAVAIMVAPWLIVVGAVCILAGWLYTGGSHPYGYRGLGELAVFVFFGVVATSGTTFVATGHLYLMAVVASISVGLLSVALLVTNNLRDIEGDYKSGKMTLAVRMGAPATRLLYIFCLVAAFGCAIGLAIAYDSWWALLVLACIPLAIGPSISVAKGSTGPSLIRVLVATGRLQLAFGLLFSIGIGWSAR